MKENEEKGRSMHMNNNTRNTRQPDNRTEGRQEKAGGQQSQPQQNRPWRNDNYRREGQGYKSYNRDYRDGHGRDNNFKTANPSAAAIVKKIKTEETIEDIREDLARIEKEIELEIKQIATMRLGV